MGSDRESVSYSIDQLNGYLTFYDNALASICLYADAWYKDVEIIGLTVEEFESVLGIEHTCKDNTFVLDDGSEMTHYEWDMSQVLASVKDGVVDSYAFSNFDL